jgi:hypothetical protein
MATIRTLEHFTECVRVFDVGLSVYNILLKGSVKNIIVALQWAKKYNSKHYTISRSQISDLLDFGLANSNIFVEMIVQTRCVFISIYDAELLDLVTGQFFNLETFNNQQTLHFLWRDGSLYWIKDFNYENVVQCMRCFKYYVCKHRCIALCVRCLHSPCLCFVRQNNSQQGDYEENRLMFKKGKLLFTKDEEGGYCHSKDLGIIIRLFYDYECCPDNRGLLHVVCVNVIVNIIINDGKMKFLGDINPELNCNLLNIIIQLGEKCGLIHMKDEDFNYIHTDTDSYPDVDRCWSTSLVEQILMYGGGSVGFSKTLTKREFQMLISKDQQFSQDIHPANCFTKFHCNLYRIFAECDDSVSECFPQMERLLIPKLLKVISVGFNNCGFDEHFNFIYRTYISGRYDKIQPLFRGRDIIQNKTVKSSLWHERNWRVVQDIWDIRRYTGPGTLSELSKAFFPGQKTKQKGACDFEYLNEHYAFVDGFETVHRDVFMITNAMTKGGDVNEEFNLAMLQVHDEVVDITELRENRISFILLMKFYCMQDVIATAELSDEFSKQMINIQKKFLVEDKPDCNIFMHPSLPTFGMLLFKRWFQINSPIKFQGLPITLPQGFLDDFGREAMYGGRSEIYVLGRLIGKKVGVIDINGMYSDAMTGPFPLGYPKYGNIDNHIAELQAFLLRVRGTFFRKTWNYCYEERSTDFGIMTAMCKCYPPEREEDQFHIVTVPYRGKGGCMLYTYEYRLQVLTSLDMETLARSGWGVIIEVTYPIIYWPPEKLFMVLADFNKFNQQNKILAKRNGEKVVEKCYKLINNALYGKQLQKKPLVQTSVKRTVEYKSDISILPIANPFNVAEEYNTCGMHLDPMYLVKEKVLSTEVKTTTVSYYGALCLSYSRIMFAQMAYWGCRQEEIGVVKPANRELGFCAAETDSLHLTEELISRFPPEVFGDDNLGWNPKKKDVEFKLKFEDFKDGKEVRNVDDAIYFAKKIYALQQPDSTYVKMASKGFDKTKTTKDVLLRALKLNETIELSKVTFSSQMGRDKVEGQILVDALIRRIQPNYNGKWLGTDRMPCDLYKPKIERMRNRKLDENFVMLLNYSEFYPQSEVEPETKPNDFTDEVPLKMKNVDFANIKLNFDRPEQLWFRDMTLRRREYTDINTSTGLDCEDLENVSEGEGELEEILIAEAENESGSV